MAQTRWQPIAVPEQMIDGDGAETTGGMAEKAPEANGLAKVHER